jgi:hypothetical protein
MTDNAENKAIVVPIVMSHDDFEHLSTASASWDQLISPDNLGRFEDIEIVGAPLESDRKVIHWFGSDSTSYLLAKSYLRAQGFGYSALYDVSMHENGEPRGYVLLTDYDAEQYR